MKASIFATLFLTAAAAAQTYTVRQFGPTCGANMAGQVVQTPQGHALRLGVRSVLENSLAVLVIGRRAPAPINLPGPSPCQLFLDSRGTMLALTNGNGNVQFGFRIPPVLPIRISFQTVVAKFSPQGVRVASSDVVRLTGQ